MLPDLSTNEEFLGHGRNRLPFPCNQRICAGLHPSLVRAHRADVRRDRGALGAQHSTNVFLRLRQVGCAPHVVRIVPMFRSQFLLGCTTSQAVDYVSLCPRFATRVTDFRGHDVNGSPHGDSLLDDAWFQRTLVEDISSNGMACLMVGPFAQVVVQIPAPRDRPSRIVLLPGRIPIIAVSLAWAPTSSAAGPPYARRTSARPCPLQHPPFVACLCYEHVTSRT